MFYSHSSIICLKKIVFFVSIVVAGCRSRNRSVVPMYLDIFKPVLFLSTSYIVCFANFWYFVWTQFYHTSLCSAVYRTKSLYKPRDTWKLVMRKNFCNSNNINRQTKILYTTQQSTPTEVKTSDIFDIHISSFLHTEPTNWEWEIILTFLTFMCDKSTTCRNQTLKRKSNNDTGKCQCIS